jgi:predicted nucleotidyltransferase
VRSDLLPQLCSHYRVLFGERLLALAMFGSRARGDARPESDIDLMLIAEALPADPFERTRLVRAQGLEANDPSVSVRALSPSEYERDIAPIDLDIALDASVLYDRDSYLAQRLDLIRQRIEQAGLIRAPDLTWSWRRWPNRTDWAVTWEGVRL